MVNSDDILKKANQYQNNCLSILVKTAFIRKLPNGKYRVLSEKGKNLGEYDSLKKARHRLRMIEYFKHTKWNK